MKKYTRFRLLMLVFRLCGWKIKRELEADAPVVCFHFTPPKWFKLFKSQRNHPPFTVKVPESETRV